MHASSFENMDKCYRKYIAGGALEKKATLKILDVGGANVNGNYSDICPEMTISIELSSSGSVFGCSRIIETPSPG